MTKNRQLLRKILLVTFCIASSALWYNHVNAVPHLRQLAFDAVQLKQSKDRFVDLINQDPMIRIEKKGVPKDEVIAFADKPFQLFSTNIMVVITFKDGIAVKSREEISIAAL